MLADAEGNSPLHVAAEQGNAEAVEMFMYFECMPGQINKASETPLMAGAPR